MTVQFFCCPLVALKTVLSEVSWRTEEKTKFGSTKEGESHTCTCHQQSNHSGVRKHARARVCVCVQASPARSACACVCLCLLYISHNSDFFFTDGYTSRLTTPALPPPKVHLLPCKFGWFGFFPWFLDILGMDILSCSLHPRGCKIRGKCFRNTGIVLKHYDIMTQQF